MSPKFELFFLNPLNPLNSPKFEPCSTVKSSTSTSKSYVLRHLSWLDPHQLFQLVPQVFHQLL